MTEPQNLNAANPSFTGAEYTAYEECSGNIDPRLLSGIKDSDGEGSWVITPDERVRCCNGAMEWHDDRDPQWSTLSVRI